jgi:Helix-turn-helix domain
MDGDKLYSPKAAKEFLHLKSHLTIYKWLSQKKMQRTKIGGKTLIRESELLKLIVDGAPPRKLQRAAKTDATATDVKV